ncbi:MAG: hypothetical protein HFI31_14785 [Lachnospiraceae bacterium]|jgi:transcription initiation factor IIE alpha subunit|nr:hypothetical protein [uncultured Acetatifactor sp.]MCI9135428.1 hypothetical protein [Lachnospiraceae bacterium]
MKEYHVINILEGIYEDYVRDNDKEYTERNLALTEAVKALTEIQQYRAIGTVEECQEAREKQRAKKPIHDGLYACPNCHTIMLQGAFEARGKCCKECGQALDWSETV